MSILNCLKDKVEINMNLEKMIDETKAEYYFDLSNFRFREVFEGHQYVWDVLKELDKYIINKLKELGKGDRSGVRAGAYVADNVHLGNGTTVDHTAVIHGPTIIGANCEIRAGAQFRGNVLVGDGAVLGGEYKSSILFDEANAPHYCYVGNSIVGYRTNMAAGVVTSPHNFSWTPIKIKIGNQEYETGMTKIGSIVGDGTMVGSNCVLNPGSLIGQDSVIYPLISWRGFLPSQKVVKSHLEIVDRDMSKGKLRVGPKGESGKLYN